MGLPLKPMAMFALVREFQAIATERPTLAVAGHNELVAALRRELERGGESGTLVSSWRGATGLLWVQVGPLSDADTAELRAANAAHVPIAAVVVGPPDQRLPYVLATEHVHIGPGEAFPIEEIAGAIGRSVGERASGIAARLPALRDGICAALVKNAARRSALVGSVIPIPGADLPVIALTQVRLVLRIAHAYGEAVDTQRLPELLGVVIGGIGMRGVARQLAGSILPGWLVKGTVAYGGTRAIGEAAIRYFQHRASSA
jgi:uncharacterized protein (DUF697 family)